MMKQALVLLLCSGCATGYLSLSEVPKGVWRSNGSGYLLDVSDHGFDAYNITSVSCQLSESYQGQSIPSDLATRIVRSDSRFTVYGGHDLFPTTYTPLPELPKHCLGKLQDTPTNNFEVFAAIFGDHYGFFDLYGVNWNETVRRTRPLIHDGMSERELFENLAHMIAPLNDGHISLTAEIGGEEWDYSPERGLFVYQFLEPRGGLEMSDGDKFYAYLLNYGKENVATQILGGNGKQAARGIIQYGVLQGGVGYINLLAMDGFSGREDDQSADLAAFEASMDDAFMLFSEGKVSAIIVDVSLNVGGYSFISQHLAERFTTVRTPAYFYSPLDGHEEEIFQSVLMPNDRPGFAGPVVLVTSDATVSAAEDFTLMMRSLPNVTHVGQRTNGIFSDVLEKELPNGWQVGLSNSEARDMDGNAWEGKGIPPQIYLPILDDAGGHTHHVATIEQIRLKLATGETP